MSLLGLPDDLQDFQEAVFTAYINSDSIRFKGRSMIVSLTILPEDVDSALVLRLLGGQAIPMTVSLKLYDEDEREARDG